MTPDVLIIGAGLAGLATAWHLAPHMSVHVLEQGLVAGGEASSQNAGLVRRLGEDPIERALAVRTAAWMADPGSRWSRPPPARAVGAVLGLAIDGHHLHDGVAHLRARGITVTSDPRPEQVAPALTGSHLLQAWWIPDELVADPAALVDGFAKGVAQHGSQLRLGIRVHALRERGGRVVGVDTDQGPIDAPRVVIAAGAWSQGLVSPFGLDRPLIPLRRALMRSAAHSLSDPQHPWVWIDDVGVYVRPDRGGWLLCGCDEVVDVPALGPGSMGEVGEAGIAAVMAKVVRHLPALADVRIETAWSGLRTFAPDRRPMLGADPELDGLWWAAGLGGFGVTGGYAAGEAVATWMLDRPTPWLSARAVDPGRAHLRRWPIRPHGDLGTSTLIDVVR